jgi:hypothetical protein
MRTFVFNWQRYWKTNKKNFRPVLISLVTALEKDTESLVLATLVLDQYTRSGRAEILLAKLRANFDPILASKLNRYFSKA